MNIISILCYVGVGSATASPSLLPFGTHYPLSPAMVPLSQTLTPAITPTLAPAMASALPANNGGFVSTPVATVPTLPSLAALPPSAHNNYSLSYPSYNTIGPRYNAGECRDYKVGNCTRGERCKFSHEIQVCGDNLKGKCQRGAGTIIEKYNIK